MPLISKHDVLIVDDSTSQLHALSELCKCISFREVRNAKNGDEALKAMRESIPSLVLLDLEMPQIDGVQVLQKMVQEGIRTPIVLASGKDPALISTVEQMGRELGLPILGALRKPLKKDDLSDLINRVYPTKKVEKSEFYHPDHVIEMALNNGHIIPYYQPKVTLNGRLLKGAELLARWKKDDELIPPAQFIPVIEARGWSTELTLQMLRHGLNQWQIWASRGLRLSMSINLSLLSMHGEALIPQIEEMVKKSKVPPRYIIFEITETAVAHNIADAMAVAARLRLAGFGLSIDDFGTGFATMQQLVRFPFTELKIDRSLVNGINNKVHFERIVHSIIELGQRMNLTTVAEGIESLADHKCLNELGCLIGQGYFYSKPLSSKQFEEWISQRIHSK